jgi:hypothetical protein
MKNIRQSGMSLIEIMVSVTLLAVIVIGLLAVFNNTTKALRIANNMTDVFEGARATDDLVVRDFAGLTAAGDSTTYNIYAADLAIPPLVFTLPEGTQQTNLVQDLFFVSRENDTWFATGYYIDQKQAGLGTLYRFSTNGPWYDAFSFDTLSNWYRAFTNGTADGHRVTDGIVHFKVQPYDAKGRIYDPNTWVSVIAGNTNISPNVQADLTNNIRIAPEGFAFSGRFTPAYVEVEIGILEPESTRRFNAIAANNPSGAQAFLNENAGKIHLFRQRIPVRNHLTPPAFD